MYKIIYHEYGDPGKVCQFEECELKAPSESQVQIQWICSNLSPSDMATIRGLYKIRQDLPAVPGYEGVGIISAVGKNVNNYKVGQKVLLEPSRTLHPEQGCWQSAGNYELKNVLSIPEGIEAENETLALLFNTFLSSWVMVREIANIGSTNWLIVNAGGSSIGRTAIQIAKIFGFNVIAVIRSSEKKEALLKDGATAVIATDQEDIVQKVKVLTNFKGAHAAIDSVGGDIGGQCFRALGEQGTMVVCGLLAQERYAPIDTKQALFSSKTVQGFWLPDWWHQTPETQRLKVFNEVLHWISQGRLQPRIQSYFSLKNYQEAIATASSSNQPGKVLFKNNED